MFMTIFTQIAIITLRRLASQDKDSGSSELQKLELSTGVIFIRLS